MSSEDVDTFLEVIRELSHTPELSSRFRKILERMVRVEDPPDKSYVVDLLDRKRRIRKISEKISEKISRT
jgi:hypothetical protein